MCKMMIIKIGINDKWIAREGYAVGTIPGYQLMSPNAA
jgi:hypothetical protein